MPADGHPWVRFSLGMRQCGPNLAITVGHGAHVFCCRVADDVDAGLGCPGNRCGCRQPVPEGRGWLLEAFALDRYVLETIVLPFEVDDLRLQALHQHLVGFPVKYG